MYGRDFSKKHNLIFQQVHLDLVHKLDEEGVLSQEKKNSSKNTRNYELGYKTNDFKVVVRVDLKYKHQDPQVYLF